MADSRLAKLKEAAKKKKEAAAAKSSPKAEKAPPAPEKPLKAPEPKKEAPAKRAEPAVAPRPREPQRPRKTEPIVVDDQVDAAFESGPAKKPKFEPVGPVIIPPSFQMDPSKIKRDPSPGKYGKLIDLVRENEALTTSADVYAVLMACIRRYSEVEGRAKSVKDLVTEETKKYVQSKKKK